MNNTFYVEIDRFLEDMRQEKALKEGSKNILDYYSKQMQDTQSFLSKFKKGSTPCGVNVQKPLETPKKVTLIKSFPTGMLGQNPELEDSQVNFPFKSGILNQRRFGPEPSPLKVPTQLLLAEDESSDSQQDSSYSESKRDATNKNENTESKNEATLDN